MPVAEPDVSSAFVAALKLVVEEAEFGLRGQATATNGSISGETIVVSNDRPEVGDLYRNWPVESADLSYAIAYSVSHLTFGKAIEIMGEELPTIILPPSMTQVLGNDTFPSPSFQNS